MLAVLVDALQCLQNCAASQTARNVETLLNRIDLPLEWPAQLSALGID